MELVVVVGIIALLVALLIPAAVGTRKRAGFVKCQSNLMTLYKGFLGFALDHNDFLPGNYYTRNESEYWKTDWLGGPGPLPDTGPNPDPATINAAFQATPRQGTVFPYIGRQPLVLRCPVIPLGEYGAGNGSNGKFDYSAVGIFAGAQPDKIHPISQLTNPRANSSEPHPTPLIVEEDSGSHINHRYIEGCHGHVDRFSRVHDQGSSYAATDGSLHFLSPPPEANFHSWLLLTPSEIWWTQLTDLQNRKFGLVWGEWNRK